MVASAFLQFSIAWLYGLFFEYAVHRWILHGFGKKRDSILSFHFHEHHSLARRRNMHDEGYLAKGFYPNSKTKEIIALVVAFFIHIPIAVIFPWAGLAVFVSMLSYYRVHSKSHKNVEWARFVLPWHYDHHMGPNQNKNFGVRTDFFDRVFKTRKKYYGTRAEKIDYHRRLGRYAQYINRKRSGEVHGA